MEFLLTLLNNLSNRFTIVHIALITPTPCFDLKLSGVFRVTACQV